MCSGRHGVLASSQRGRGGWWHSDAHGHVNVLLPGVQVAPLSASVWLRKRDQMVHAQTKGI